MAAELTLKRSSKEELEEVFRKVRLEGEREERERGRGGGGGGESLDFSQKFQTATVLYSSMLVINWTVTGIEWFCVVLALRDLASNIKVSLQG